LRRTVIPAVAVSGYPGVPWMRNTPAGSPALRDSNPSNRGSPGLNSTPRMMRREMPRSKTVWPDSDDRRIFAVQTVGIDRVHAQRAAPTAPAGKRQPGRSGEVRALSS